jgi:UDP-2,3-diacylglucosamine pyrophosphatase LpxH
MKVRSIFVSDVHLGSEYSNHKKFLDFISNIECENLYIVGDFIDGWMLKRNFKWHKDYNTILQKILRMSRKNTFVTYIIGNHDDFLNPFNNTIFGENIKICNEASHVTLKKQKLLIIQNYE